MYPSHKKTMNSQDSYNNQMKTQSGCNSRKSCFQHHCVSTAKEDMTGLGLHHGGGEPIRRPSHSDSDKHSTVTKKITSKGNHAEVFPSMRYFGSL